MARADFAASVKSYSRPLFYRAARTYVRVCVRARGDTKETTPCACTLHCVYGDTRAATHALSRAWAVDFSKHIITESQLHDASAHGNGAIR